MKNRRFGRFRLPIELLDQRPETAQGILRDVLVIQAWNDADYVYYLGVHPQFGFVPVGCDIPAYEAHTVDGVCRWTKVRMFDSEPRVVHLSKCDLTKSVNPGRRSEYEQERRSRPTRPEPNPYPPEVDDPRVEIAECYHEADQAEPDFERIAEELKAQQQVMELATALPVIEAEVKNYERKQRQPQRQNTGEGGQAKVHGRWDGPWPLRDKQES